MASKKPAQDNQAPRPDVLGRDLSNAVIFFHEAIAAHLGMSAAEWKCLGLLDQQGPSTAGRLAELSGFTTGAITGIVDRLERAGYVRRRPHLTDRRSVIIEPLAVKGVRERVVPVFESLTRAMMNMQSHYSQKDLAKITKFMAETTNILRQETAKLKQTQKREKARFFPEDQ